MSPWFHLLLVLARTTGVAWAREVRTPRDPVDLRYWLENRVGHHGYSVAEVASATGLVESEIEAALGRWRITRA